MKRLWMTAGIVMLLVGVALAQQSGGGMGQMGGQGQPMMMRQDTAQMRMMMQHIASDPQMRREMVRYLAREADRDSSARLDLMRMVLEDPEMNTIMTRMVERDSGAWKNLREQHGMGGGMHRDHMQQGGMHKSMGEDSTKSDTTRMRARENERNERK